MMREDTMCKFYGQFIVVAAVSAAKRHRCLTSNRPLLLVVGRFLWRSDVVVLRMNVFQQARLTRGGADGRLQKSANVLNKRHINV